MSRIAAALLALSLLTAFAPAPFPKTQRRVAVTEISLATFQGTWRVTSMRTARANGAHTPYTWEVTHVRITKDQWEYMENGRSQGPRLFGIDPTKKPAHFNFLNRGPGMDTVSAPGLIRRQGDRIDIIYTWGSPEVRSPSFEAPTDGHWLLSLQRER
jgi:uncharacterized protein (TIGR03067 family)